MEIRRNFTKDYETRKQEIQNQTIKVTTVIEPPYVMWRMSTKENISWNDMFRFVLAPNGSNTTSKFVGFCMDILLDLADRLNFTFEIDIVKDKTFGKKNEKGEWNGIIGELVYRVCIHPSLFQHHRILLF